MFNVNNLTSLFSHNSFISFKLLFRLKVNYGMFVKLEDIEMEISCAVGGSKVYILDVNRPVCKYY